MKRLVLSLAILLAAGLCLRAQDIITFKSGSTLEAKVLEVTPEIVKYKKVANPNGPVYTAYVDDLSSIRYENGSTDEFGPVRQPQPEPAPAPEVREPQRYYRNETVYHDVRYRDIKGMYDTRYYRSAPDDPYSRAASGLASFVIPGLGQALDGEWGRGALFFAGNVIMTILDFSALSYNLVNSYDASYSYRTSSYGLLSDGGGNAPLGLLIAAHCILQAWCISDAIQVATVKNMYYQDMEGRLSSVDLRLEPSLTMVPAGTAGLQPAAGLSLKLSF